MNNIVQNMSKQYFHFLLKKTPAYFVLHNTVLNVKQSCPDQKHLFCWSHLIPIHSSQTWLKWKWMVVACQKGLQNETLRIVLCKVYFLINTAELEAMVSKALFILVPGGG